MKIVSSLFFLLFYCICYSQVEYEAFIVDGFTNEPIVDANIRIIGSNQGAISDKEGHFKLSFQQLPTTIVVSHVSYSEERREVTSIFKSKEVIYLYPRNDRLKEITIKAENVIKTLSEVESYSVQDFEIVSNRIFRLEFHNHIDKFNVSITDLDGHLEQRINLKALKGVHGLFKSCNGIVYILAKYKAYALVEIDYRFELGPAILIDKFDRNVRPCKLRVGSKLFFINSDVNDLVNKISSYDIDKEEYSLISVIADQDLVQGLYRDLSLMRRGQDVMSVLTTSPGENRRIRNLQESSDFLITVFYKPDLPVCISSIKQDVVIFNHIERKIERYNKLNELIAAVEVDYVLDDKWLKEIRVDQRTRKAYGIFKLKTGIGVKHIDLESGEVKLVGIVETPFQNYTKIKIFNGSIYYLNDSGRMGANMELLKFDL